MALQPGTRLGPYEVVAPLGAGGMGEVYRGKDTRLDRTVAVKVLPSLLADDPEFRERFDREARSISALTHPNICTLYDVGEHRFDDGSVTRFLVMEFLEGETLAARLEQGALPINEALRIAIDIAGALDKAHRNGVIHRDLKPANVMLTKSGAKLLDFGLAKSNHGVVSTATGTLATMTSPAGRTAPLTTQGAILGTIQYMAPEQVEGEEAGPRSDLFSFGAVLFEMITGRRAFSGKSQASLLGSIMKEEAPPITQLKPDAPRSLERLVKACLAKDPNERLQSAHDLLLELRWIQEGGSVAAPLSRRNRIAWIALAVVTALWIATLVPAVRSFRSTPDPLKVEFTVGTANTALNNGLSLAVSPNGRMLAYVSPPEEGGPGVLWIRAFDDLQPRRLPGTEGAFNPFWSPDSASIGFYASNKLLIIRTDGGQPQPIVDVRNLFYGATWNTAGTILVSHGNTGTNIQLSRVSARGGEMTTVAQPDQSQRQIGLLSPQFLPDGRRYIYMASTSDPSARAIYSASLDGGAPVLLTRSSGIGVVSQGYLLYLRDTSLVAQRLDSAGTSLTGEAIPIVESIMFHRTSGRVAISASNNGVLAYRTGGATEPVSQLVWLNRSGQQTGTLGDPAAYNQFRLSPDGKRVAAVVPDPRTYVYCLWTMDVASGILTQSTSNPSNDPLWSPDSQSVMFESLPKGKRDFYRQTVGSRTATAVYESDEDPKWLDDWSPDGKFALYHSPRPGKLFALPLSGSVKPMLLAEASTFEGAHFSPDSKWVVYQQSDGGEYEVWVASFPKFDSRRRISPRGGGQPFWRRDGKELFYLTPDGKMMSVAVVPDASSPGGMEFRAPVELFASPLSRPLLNTDQYSVTADGQRFLFMKPQRESGIFPSMITVVMNWDARNAER